MEGGVEAGEEFGVVVVAIGGKPWLGAGVDTCGGLTTTVEDIFPKLSLINVFKVFAVRDILAIFIGISVGAIGSLRLVELLFESLEIEGSLLLWVFLLLLEVREVKVFSDGAVRRCGFRGRGRCARGILALNNTCKSVICLSK